MYLVNCSNMWYLNLCIRCFFVCLLLSCTKNKSDLKTDLSLYENGDIVFRQGNSSVSNAVLVADEKADYSHVGIVVLVNEVPFVIHACPPEIESFNSDNKIKMDSISVFFSTQYALHGALYRFCDNNIAEKTSENAIQLYNDSISFDYNFDSNDSTEMYCTELVDFVYKKQNVALSGNIRHHVCIPGMNIENCILISDLQNSDKLKKIISF